MSNPYRVAGDATELPRRIEPAHDEPPIVTAMRWADLGMRATAVRDVALARECDFQFQAWLDHACDWRRRR